MKRNRNKHRSGTTTTLNGTTINNVAMNKHGLPILGEKLSFVTVGINSGSVRDRSKAKAKLQKVWDSVA
jgi:hypothetical protein